MNFKTLKLYYKLCRTHYMFRPIWPSSGVKIYIKIAFWLFEVLFTGMLGAIFVLLVPCTVVMNTVEASECIISGHSATGCYDTIL
jgi:hypothetical protein